MELHRARAAGRATARGVAIVSGPAGGQPQLAPMPFWDDSAEMTLWDGDRLAAYATQIFFFTFLD